MGNDVSLRVLHDKLILIPKKKKKLIPFQSLTFLIILPLPPNRMKEDDVTAISCHICDHMLRSIYLKKCQHCQGP